MTRPTTVLRTLLRDRVTAVWAVLIVAAVVSVTLGTEKRTGHHAIASTLIIAIALVKVRLVGLHFMELRHAPIGLRILFEAYCVGACGILMGMFLIR